MKRRISHSRYLHGADFKRARNMYTYLCVRRKFVDVVHNAYGFSLNLPVPETPFFKNRQRRVAPVPERGRKNRPNRLRVVTACSFVMRILYDDGRRRRRHLLLFYGAASWCRKVYRLYINICIYIYT